MTKKWFATSACTHLEARSAAGIASRVSSVATTLTLGAILLAGAVTARAGTCTINGGTTYQTIDGIGFSSAWSGQLSNAKNNALYNTLGMSLLRVRIDANKNWSEEKANASAAHSAGAKVLGTPWTPPASMKSNNNTVNGTLNTSQYAAYASFLASAASTIGLDYVSVQNEPDIKVTYESCTWSGAQIATFCANNASSIGKPVVMAESFNFNDALSDPALNNSTAASRVTIVAGHIYGGGLKTHTNALNHNKRVWMTEHYISNSQSNISACMTIAKEINDCMNNRMSAYFWWWVSDSDTSINLVNNGGTIFKNGYTIGQWAKWVRPGKVRIASTYNPTSNVYVTAYRNNGLVIVAVNTGSSAVTQTFSLSNITGVTSLLVNRTSSNENMASVSSATVSSNAFTYKLPAQSITTFHQF